MSIIVEDDGPGIPEEQFRNVFKPVVILLPYVNVKDILATKHTDEVAILA